MIEFWGQYVFNDRQPKDGSFIKTTDHSIMTWILLLCYGKLSFNYTVIPSSISYVDNDFLNINNDHKILNHALIILYSMTLIAYDTEWLVCKARDRKIFLEIQHQRFVLLIVLFLFLWQFLSFRCWVTRMI